MGCNIAEVAQVLGNSPGVHISMCKELRKLMDKTLCLIPAIESARPGCMLGIMELCSLNKSIEKAQQLIEHFAEFSKLYLVITGDASVSRCERLRSTVEKSLTHIHTMVPEPLATQISNAIDSLRDIKFVIDSSDEEARKALLSLLRQNDATENSEFLAFQIAASKLHLTSSKALLVERRCVKKLLDKFSGADLKKERILKYLMHLLTTYGKKVQAGACEYNENVSVVSAEPLRKRDSSGEVNFLEKISMPIERIQQEVPPENDVDSDLSRGALTPEEFRCPITSTLMYDPVVIASGQTFERIHIEKWFSEGHNTCPKTRIKLPNLTITPNSNLKTLISQWCQTHGIALRYPYLQQNPKPFRSWDTLNSSSTSFNSVSGVVLDNRNADYIFQTDYSNTSVMSSDASWISDSSCIKGIVDSADVNHAHIFMWSDDYQKYHSFSNFSYDLYMKFLSELSQLPLEVHLKALEDLKILLSEDEVTCCLMFTNGFLESLVMFLKDAFDSSNIIAQKVGVQILLDFLKYSRVDVPSLSDKACSLLTCFLDSTKVNLEALKIIRAFCSYHECKPTIAALGVTWPIMDTLDSEDPKLLEIAVEILDQLSSIGEVALLISSSVCLLKLSSLIMDKQFAGVCLKILRNLCDTKEGLTAIAKADGCVSSIVEHLEYGSLEEQAVAVFVLLSLCSCSSEYCDLVMKEGVIPPLVDMSVNGNVQGKRDSKKLLQILRDLSRQNDCLESSVEISKPASDSPPSTKTLPVHNSEDENLHGYNDNLHSSVPFGGSSSQSSTKFNNSRKESPAHKSSRFFGRKISIFSKT